MTNSKKIDEYDGKRVRLKSGKEGIISDTGNDYKTYYGLIEKYEGRIEVVLIKQVKIEDIDCIIDDIPLLTEKLK